MKPHKITLKEMKNLKELPMVEIGTVSDKLKRKMRLRREFDYDIF